MKPLSQMQEKLPPGRLTQRPWGPHTPGAARPATLGPASNPQPSITAAMGRGRPIVPLLQAPPRPHRPRPHLCRPLQGTGPWARSNSCRPCSRGRHSSSRPPGCSSWRRPSRGSAHRGRCPPAGWGHCEGLAAPGGLARCPVHSRSPRGPEHRAPQPGAGGRPARAVQAARLDGNTCGPPGLSVHHSQLPLPARRHPAVTPAASRKASP